MDRSLLIIGAVILFAWATSGTSPAPTPTPQPDDAVVVPDTDEDIIPAPTPAPACACGDCICKKCECKDGECDCEDCEEHNEVDDAPAPVALEDYVKRIHITLPDGTGYNGSGTYIGDGKYLTCAHLFRGRSGYTVEIGGVVVGQSVVIDPARDVAVLTVTPALPDLHAVTIATVLPADGAVLAAVGASTGRHDGVLSAQRYVGGVRRLDASDGGTEQGDSGAGVFDGSGQLVGVHWGGVGSEIFFTPLSEVVGLLEGGVAPPAVSNSSMPSDAAAGFAVSLRTDGLWWWQDAAGMWWHTGDRPVEGQRYEYPGYQTFIHSGGSMRPDGVAGQQQAQQPQRQAKWVQRRVCRNGVCSMEWQQVWE